MNCIIAADKFWTEDMLQPLIEQTPDQFILITDYKTLTQDRLNEIKPRYIFFPYWSRLIPANIYENFECVIFHMTDLPFGRGGSPLQNLIARGIYETKVSAIRCIAELDAGPVYLKRPLTLQGKAQDIYQRVNSIVKEMIITIAVTQPAPIPQEGEIVCFKRRTPEQGNLAKLTELLTVYDYIRMLDADNYPRAFIETDHLKLEFEEASLQNEAVYANVKITRK